VTTHVFTDPTDYTKGGTWLGDYWRHVCRWTWNAAKQELTVICGPHGKRMELRCRQAMSHWKRCCLGLRSKPRTAFPRRNALRLTPPRSNGVTPRRG
jgi:hypothetical protein